MTTSPDYAALIERLKDQDVRNRAVRNGAHFDQLLDEAASALRALLAENARLLREETEEYRDLLERWKAVVDDRGVIEEERDSLRAQVAALEKDAARYRKALATIKDLRCSSFKSYQQDAETMRSLADAALTRGTG